MQSLVAGELKVIPRFALKIFIITFQSCVAFRRRSGDGQPTHFKSDRPAFKGFITFSETSFIKRDNPVIHVTLRLLGQCISSKSVALYPY